MQAQGGCDCFREPAGSVYNGIDVGSRVTRHGIQIGDSHSSKPMLSFHSVCNKQLRWEHRYLVSSYVLYPT